MPLYRAAKVNILSQSATALSAHTGTTNETVLWTVSIAGGRFPAGTMFEIEAYLSNITNDASAKTLQVRVGASGAGTGGTLMHQPSLASVATYNARCIMLLAALSGAGAQVGLLNNGGLGGASAAVTTAAIDTTAAWEFVLSLTLADGTDSITPRGYRIRYTLP